MVFVVPTLKVNNIKSLKSILSVLNVKFVKNCLKVYRNNLLLEFFFFTNEVSTVKMLIGDI